MILYTIVSHNEIVLNYFFNTLIAKLLGCKGSHKTKSQEALSAEVVKAGKGRNPGDPSKMETECEEALRKPVLGPPWNAFKLD